MEKSILEKQYLISVVVPVYDTEKYLDRCIESLFRQTYTNLEILLVDDGSPGQVREMAAQYGKQDRRVRLISHKINRGLFQARLTGAAAAKGEFLAFLDSDDYVSSDYYHTLLDAAVCRNADIAVGNTVHETAEGKYVRNLHNACFRFDSICGEELRQAFFSQKGLCFAWHTVWNKLYRKELWSRCEEYYKELNAHIVMTEDIAFSTVLFSFARCVTTVQNDAYFYCQNEQASTDHRGMTFEKFEKNMRDIHNVFDFCETFLEKSGNEDRNFHDFRKYYARLWRTLSAGRFLGGERDKREEILKNFCPDETRRASRDDYFFDSVQTPWNGELEYRKEQIAASDSGYVSFDIFDTLVQRPFYQPQHLFMLLNKEWEKHTDSCIDIAQMRMAAERLARIECSRKQPKWEDVTLQEIYECMVTHFFVSKEVAACLMRKEQQLEIQFCSVRNAGRELYETALLSGKKVLLISDMYLDEDTVKEILKRNGYTHYHRLFLSSKLRLSKYTGNLFSYVAKKQKLAAGSTCHIGDTWQSDVINAKKHGFVPLFLPKAIEAFENIIQGVQTNGCAFLAEAAAGFSNMEEIKQSVGFGCMLALVANKYFDNPFQSFHKESDLNIDPFFTGYYPLGMHLLGIVRWVLAQSVQKGTKDIYFLARDGALVKKAYEVVTQAQNGNTAKAHYLYASRKALLCGMIKSRQDFFCLPVVYANHSPKTMLELLKFAAKPEMTSKEHREILTDYGIMYDKRFEHEETYIRFIKAFTEKMYSKAKLEESRELARRYYDKISENALAFDLGYSGRIQAAISGLLGRGVDVMFVHSDRQHADRMQRMGRFHVHAFYPMVPKVSGLLREHLLSDYGPACVGFAECEGQVQPKLEPESKLYQDVFIVATVQKAALQFVRDFTHTFLEYEAYLPYSPFDVSMPFEGYLRRLSDADRKIYGASYFEDLVYGASRNINIDEFLNMMMPLQDGTANARNTARFRHFVWLRLKDHKILYTFGKLAGRLYDKIFK